MTEQTKQITFEGQTYTVPVWVKWVARDESGYVFGFDKKPRRYSINNRWEVSIKNKAVRIDYYDWRQSLAEV